MTGIERRPEAETKYRDHLQRSETVWDRWSDWYRLSERDFEPVRTELITRLGLETGDRVLEIGCGPGVNFSLIREAIGDDGQLVAIDYSPAMVTKARERIAANGWENIVVVRGDATTPDLGGRYDAAIATLALSVMPDIKRAVRNIHSVLKPGASLGILDLQEFQSGLIRVVNPLLRGFLRWYANWNANDDVQMAIDDVFGGYEQLNAHMLGTVYTIQAVKSGN